MALLVYYTRIRDDPGEVEYRFGGAREDLDRTLIIDKVNDTVDADERKDALFRAAARQIIARAKRDNAWPQHGVVAS